MSVSGLTFIQKKTNINIKRSCSIKNDMKFKWRGSHEIGISLNFDTFLIYWNAFWSISVSFDSFQCLKVCTGTGLEINNQPQKVHVNFFTLPTIRNVNKKLNYQKCVLRINQSTEELKHRMIDCLILFVPFENLRGG